MSESALLQQILTQASRAAEKSAANGEAILGLQRRLDTHVDSVGENLNEHDERLRGVEVDVQALKTTKDLAVSAGGKAGRKHAVIIATAIIAIVEVAQRVYAAVSG